MGDVLGARRAFRAAGASVAAIVIGIAGLLGASPVSAAPTGIAVAAAAPGTLHFVVATDGSAAWNPDSDLMVRVNDLAEGWDWGTGYIGEGYEYSEQLPPGDYRIWFDYDQYEPLVNLAPPPTTVVSVRSGETTEFDGTFRRGATISGTLTAPTSGGFPLVQRVQAYDDRIPSSDQSIAATHFGDDGQYTIVGLPTGSYDIQYGWDEHPQRWATQFWQGAGDREGATPVAVTVGEDLVGYDVVQQATNSISGVLRTPGADGALVPAAFVAVALARPDEFNSAGLFGYTDGDGRFQVFDIPDGAYKLLFHSPWSSPGTWGTIDTPVYDFADGRQIADTEFMIERAGSISGTVDIRDDTGTHPPAQYSVEVQVERLDAATGTFSLRGSALPEGDYRIDSLAPGQYRVTFVDRSEANLRTEYWQDALFSSDATLVTVEAGAESSGIDATLEPSSIDVYQIGGADRYDVAAQVSRTAFEPGMPVLYIASGETYPDALSAGPAAVRQGGGLLLTTRDALPDVTKTEIQRLAPERIVVVGGPNTVSEKVLAELRGLQPETVRIGGADRYEVSRRVVEYAFCGGSTGACAEGSSTVFVATGANYPDALAAGPAAGHLDGAVLLVPGRASGLDAATRKTLTRLGADDVYIAGGPNSVSTGIETALASAVPGTVKRLSGPDRFGAAMAINREVFGSSARTAFVASGLVFPDALSGGPAAVAYDAPLLLVQKDCLPEEVVDYLLDADPFRLLMLGGPNTLGPGVTELAYVC